MVTKPMRSLSWKRRGIVRGGSGDGGSAMRRRIPMLCRGVEVRCETVGGDGDGGSMIRRRALAAWLGVEVRGRTVGSWNAKRVRVSRFGVLTIC